MKYPVVSKRNLPRIVITKVGYNVDLNNDPVIIPISRGLRYIYLKDFPHYFSEGVMNSIKDYFDFLLTKYAGGNAVSFYDALTDLVALMEPNGEITDRLLDRFRERVGESANAKSGGKLKSWLLWDIKISDNPVLSLAQAAKVRKWKFKSREPYAAIRLGKEGVGALPRRDDLRLREELRKPDDSVALAMGQTDLQVRTIITIIRQLGVRAVQVSFMKLQDLRVWEYDGRRVGVLMVPEAKNREAPRASFRQRQLSAELLAMIEAAIKDRSPDAVGDWLFSRREPLSTLPQNSPPEEYWRVTTVDQLVKPWIRNRAIPSVTGGIVKASPIRLRYTYATELAPKMTPIELGHALGHKDERTVMHYYTFDQSFFRRLSSVDGATKWGLVAANFAGLLSEVSSETDDGGAIVFGPGLELDDIPILQIGRCGALERCHLFPPFSCYGCRRFKPDPDADHEAALKALVKWREGRPTSVGKTRDPLQGQLDEVIEGAGYLVGILPAYHWARDRMRASLPKPSIDEISAASGVPVEVIAEDRSIREILGQWPVESSGSKRISKRRNARG